MVKEPPAHVNCPECGRACQLLPRVVSRQFDLILVRHLLPLLHDQQQSRDLERFFQPISHFRSCSDRRLSAIQCRRMS